MRNSHDVIARADLLRHQRLCGRHKHDFSRGEPSIEVVHDDCSDEGFAQTGGERNERVSKQRGGHNGVLILSNGIIRGVSVDEGVETWKHVGLRCFGVEERKAGRGDELLGGSEDAAATSRVGSRSRSRRRRSGRRRSRNDWIGREDGSGRFGRGGE